MTSSSLRTCARVLLTVCAVLLFARVAEAEDPAIRTAKRHYARGEKAFALGKFDEALDEYQQAYDAAPIPDFLFNIGQCHRNLGDYEAAIFSFKKFLKLEPDAPNRDKVQSLIDELEDKQARGDAKKLGFERRPPPPPPPPAEATPIYKKWWFWTGIAVAGAAGGVGIYAATRPAGAPDTTLGNIVFTK